MRATFAHHVQRVKNLTERLNVTVTQGGLATAFSVKIKMNVTRKVTTAALIQNVLIYRENTNVFARLDGSGMATIVQMSTSANSTGILAAQMKTA